MKTTVHINDDLLKAAMEIYDGESKTAIIEKGLKELIDKNNQERLARLFGSEKKLKVPRRRRNT